MNHAVTNILLDKTPWFYIVSTVDIYLYIYLHFMYLYYSCYHFPRRMGLLRSGALSEDSKLTHRIQIAYQSAFRHLNRYVATSEPTEQVCYECAPVQDANSISPVSYSYERTQTKTNNCTTIYLRSQYTLFAITFSLYIFFSSYISTILFRTPIVDCSETTDPIR